MAGGLRLLFALSSLSFLFLIAAVAFAADDSKSSSTSPSLPKAEAKPIIDMFHGTKVLDNYRWLEDGSSPETEQWVARKLAYTRSILDKLPGRESHSPSSNKLLQIGNLFAASCGGALLPHPSRGHAEPAGAVCTQGLNGKDACWWM